MARARTIGAVQRIATTRALGALGVTLLLSDCTRIEQLGRTPTEQVVVAALDRWKAQPDGRVILTTLASNISRVAFAFQAAERYGHRAAVIGRSMNSMSRWPQIWGC